MGGFGQTVTRFDLQFLPLTFWAVWEQMIEGKEGTETEVQHNFSSILSHKEAAFEHSAWLVNLLSFIFILISIEFSFLRWF